MNPGRITGGTSVPESSASGINPKSVQNILKKGFFAQKIKPI
jgi:hypothetical protein